MTETAGPAGNIVLAQAEHAQPAETHAGTEAHGGAKHGGTFPPFDSATFAGQLFWLAIFFGLLYWLMKKIAIPRVANILEGRAERIDGDLAEARRLQAESKAAIEAYEKALADARAKAQAIASETRERVAKESEENRKRIEADLNAKLEAAEAKIASTKTQALTNVRGIAVDAASAIVERLTGAPASASDIEQAVDASLAA